MSKTVYKIIHKYFLGSVDGSYPDLQKYEEEYTKTPTVPFPSVELARDAIIETMGYISHPEQETFLTQLIAELEEYKSHIWDW